MVYERGVTYALAVVLLVDGALVACSIYSPTHKYTSTVRSTTFSFTPALALYRRVAE